MPNSGGDEGVAPVKEMAGEISVLFAYTTHAACAVGGVQELKKRVNNGMALLNEALSNSNIGYSAKAIAKFVEVDYGPISSDEGIRPLLKDLADENGVFSGIHAARARLKGDIVCLIYSGYPQGLANMFNPFMVCHYEMFGDNYVFPHEFGHNLGAEHVSDAYARQKLGAPNSAVYNPVIDNTSYRTISNNGGVSVPYFSENRTVNHKFSSGDYHQIKLGSANYDNASILRKNAPIAASWGDKLSPVSPSANAAPTREVFPKTAPKSPCDAHVLNIKECYIKGNGELQIKYEAKDFVRFSGNLTGSGGEKKGGFTTILKPHVNEWSIPYPSSLYSPGDKYIIEINEKEVLTCDSRSPSSSIIEIVPASPGDPIKPNPGPTKPGVDKPAPTDKPANPTVTPSNPTKPGVDQPSPTDKPSEPTVSPTNPKEPTPDKPTISKPDVDPTWNKPAPDSPNRISPKSLAGNMYTVICADPRAKGKVMELQNAKGENTVQVIAGDATNQGTWSFEKAGAETYYIRVENSQARTAAYLDASGADVSGEDGVVSLAPKKEGSRGQYWKVTKNSNGTFRITSALGRANNKCLQADGSKLTGTSADVTLWSPTEASRQSWILKPIE